MAAVTLVGYRCALSLGSRGGRRLGRPGRAPDDHICQIRLPPPSLHIRSQSIYIGEHWLKWGPNTIGLVHFWMFLHNFGIDGNHNFFDKLSAKNFLGSRVQNAAPELSVGVLLVGRLPLGHWPEYRLSTTVQASAPACCLSLPSCGFPLLSPLACCCCYLHRPPPSLAAQVSLAPPPSVMWCPPPSNPATRTLQL